MVFTPFPVIEDGVAVTVIPVIGSENEVVFVPVVNPGEVAVNRIDSAFVLDIFHDTTPACIVALELVFNTAVPLVVNVTVVAPILLFLFPPASSA